MACLGRLGRSRSYPVTRQTRGKHSDRIALSCIRTKQTAAERSFSVSDTSYGARVSGEVQGSGVEWLRIGRTRTEGEC